MKKLLFIGTSVITLSILFLEVFTYKNILFKHFFVSSDVLFVVSLFFSWSIINTNKSGNKIIDLGTLYVFTFIKYLFIPLSIFYIYFLLLNINHYPNYVFSIYHLQPDLIVRPILFSLCISFLSYIKMQTSLFHKTLSFVKEPRKKYENLCVLILVVTLFSYGVFNFTKNINTLSPYVFLSLKNFSKNSLEKMDIMMKIKYGYYYDYIKFVKQVVPENSSLLLPPQENPWQNEGNQRLTRYFLYPRIIYSAHESNLPQDISYIVIAWGSPDFPPKSGKSYGWPKERIEASKIYIYNFENKSVTEFSENYDPDKFMKPGTYGLIKTK